ncbi:uncharacterized protein METZ01_LOCUS386308 [marine metagenome]|uniref:Filamentation induced by cAMP protein Fic-like C-terminal domain-containing protein n=1 Tax=marine metagenome TaxID=408172 RepID=A0A382UGP9_9ZZZZ
MFKFLKKEESIEEPVINHSEDWTKEIKRSQKIGQEVEQLSFIYDNNKDILILGTKKGLSQDHLRILRNCKNESSAIELMEILNRTNKSKFKNIIINPLVENGFFELTNPDKPKSPTQKYRLTSKFVRRRKKS